MYPFIYWGFQTIIAHSWQSVFVVSMYLAFQIGSHVFLFPFTLASKHFSPTVGSQVWVFCFLVRAIFWPKVCGKFLRFLLLGTPRNVGLRLAVNFLCILLFGPSLFMAHNWQSSFVCPFTWVSHFFCPKVLGPQKTSAHCWEGKS